MTCAGCNQTIVSGECGGEGEGLCMESAFAHDVLEYGRKAAIERFKRDHGTDEKAPEVPTEKHTAEVLRSWGWPTDTAP